ncbi:lysophospholipase [Belnapia sp. T18]|uniref:Lysophospholipase n=1 Tax=Belnapia arida TaxID=2804533 RepID=A0ABS1U1U4_9PROT|nr:alpha/beta fold hydrolase [Belnapia arida]MBL6077904.1 lysophospholipase [Belnapia arida]
MSLSRRLCLLGLLGAAGCTPVVMPAGLAERNPAMADKAFVTADGARLPYVSWLPEGRPRAILLALHGFGDYSFNFFEIPAPLFTGLGIGVFAYDQRGFGAGPHRGYWPGTTTLTADAAAVARLLAARYPGVPVFLAGESMGAAVALVTMAAADPPPVAGLVLLAPGVRGRASMGEFARRTLEIAAHAIPAVGFSGSAPGFSPTNNEEAMRRWGRDPLTLRTFRVDLVYGLVDLMDRALEAAPRLRTPALLLYGGEDRIVSESPVRRLLAAFGQEAPVRLGFYPKGHHLLLRDNDRAVVAHDIAAWMEAPAEPLPSGAEAAGRAWLAKAG